MGQLYKIVNVDKEEMLVPWDFSNGAKLMEWSYNNNDMILALFNLLAGEWKGDRVFVIGDYADLGYADLGNPNEPCHEALRKVLEEKMICDLYGYASKNYRNISGESDVSEYGYRYIYNHALKVVIDLDKCPIERTFWSKVEKEVCIVRISPLSLLLAIGNGRGGGDFHEGNNGYEYVGSWCDTVSDIEVTIEPLDGIDYEEFSPDFTENNPMIPYTNLADEIKKCEDISQLESLAEHCDSMIDKKDPKSIWIDDAAVLREAVKKLKGEPSGDNAAMTIRDIMEKENVSQKELAEKMGCVRQNVNQTLNRGTVSMRYDSFYRMVKALGYEIILRKN